MPHSRRGPNRRTIRNELPATTSTNPGHLGNPKNHHDQAGEGRPQSATPLERVTHVEDAFAADVSNQRFMPHLTLHEFEAWVFADLSSCSWVFDSPDAVNILQGIRESFSSEQIGKTEVIWTPPPSLYRTRAG